MDDQSETQMSAEDSDAAAILAARAGSNEAIAAHDAAGAVAAMTVDVQVIVSTGHVVAGRAAMAQAFARTFADPDFVTYVRRPVSVQIGDGIAAEQGRWEAIARGGSRAGIYLARWEKAADGWCLAREHYVPLGSYER